MEMNVEDMPAKDDPWASVIINQVVDEDGTIAGYIFVKNPDRPDAKWKFAGGHKEPGETPLETAMRENQGETGLRLPMEAFTEIPTAREWRTRPNGHWWLLFLAKVPIAYVKLLHEHDIGNEGEEVRYFTNEELETEIRHNTVLGFHLKKMPLALQQAA